MDLCGFCSALESGKSLPAPPKTAVLPLVVSMLAVHPCGHLPWRPGRCQTQLHPRRRAISYPRPNDACGTILAILLS